MKKLIINAGDVILLKHDKEFFDAFETITINTGDALFSTEAYAELAKRNFTLNAGGSNIIEVKGEALNIGNAVIDGSIDYSGKFLVGEIVRVASSDPAVLRGVTGIYSETLWLPDDFTIDADIKLHGAITRYPAGAIVTEQPIVLTEEYVTALPNNACVCTLAAVNALDSKAVAALAQKNITVRCATTLLIGASSNKQYGKQFTAIHTEAIPDDCEYIENNLTLTDTNADLYGDRLYIGNNFTIMPSAIEAFERFTYVYVRNNANIPVASLKHWKEVGTTKNNVIPYKGELWSVNGSEKITHEQLDAAVAQGKTYTLVINGAVIFDYDVTDADLGCFVEITYSGAVKAPAAIIATFKSKVSAANGALAPLKDGSNAEFDFAEPDDNTQVINTGSFVRI
ncbi:MAG: hypothetical protein LBL96_02355 [Clostridiales bacterium]|jgi:hypothetical protein|nr:hypothetical protein [Clostridiales bacterium]